MADSAAGMACLSLAVSLALAPVAAPGPEQVEGVARSALAAGVKVPTLASSIHRTRHTSRPTLSGTIIHASLPLHSERNTPVTVVWDNEMTVMKILLTNDDGIEAPGLSALAESINGNFEQIIAAPLSEQSGCSHSTTTDRPIRMQRHNANRYAIDGTPADCVRVALHEFKGEIDFVLAGINSGGNLGVDIYHSGTVAAVREATLHGVPGISVSQYRNRKLTAEDWQRAARWTGPLIEGILSRPSEPHTLWNINLPCLSPDEADPEVIECPLDLSPLPLQFRQEPTGLQYSGSYSKRARRPGADIDVCFSGKIAVTRISLIG